MHEKLVQPKCNQLKKCEIHETEEFLKTDPEKRCRQVLAGLEGKYSVWPTCLVRDRQQHLKLWISQSCC